MTLVRVPMVFLLALLLGCGSDSDPLYDGFTSVAGTAVVFAPTNCDIAFVGETAVSGVALLGRVVAGATASFPIRARFVPCPKGSLTRSALWSNRWHAAFVLYSGGHRDLASA